MEALIDTIVLHLLFHIADDPSHVHLGHMIDCDSRVREEHLRQILQEERQERVLEDAVLHRHEDVIEVVDVLCD